MGAAGLRRSEARDLAQISQVEPAARRERRDVPGQLLKTRSLHWRGGSAELVERNLPRVGDMRLCLKRVTINFSPGARARWIEHSFGNEVVFRGENNLPSVSLWPGDGELHSRYELDAEQYRKYLVVFLDLDFIQRAVGLEGAAAIALRPTVDQSHDPLTWQLARAMKAECDGPAAEGALYVESAATMLAHTLVRRYGTIAAPKLRTPRGGLAPYQLKRVRDYITAHLADDITLSELAGVVGLTPSHFCRAFKVSTGVPPHRWHVQQRVARAKSMLLASDHSLAEIASACGFFDQAHFSTAFRKTAGASPGAWRRENRA